MKRNYDGTLDPRPRCTGHCCRQFSLEYPYAQVLADLKGARQIPDVETIADMLIPVGKIRGQELFTCKNLGQNGDCQIYETRPKMCRDFPGPDPCPYRNCSSHGRQNTIRRAWNWLRD